MIVSKMLPRLDIIKINYIYAILEYSIKKRKLLILHRMLLLKNILALNKIKTFEGL